MMGISAVKLEWIISFKAKAWIDLRDKLEAAGISYHELMVLEQAHEDLGNMAHNILLGWENGEGFPHE